MKKLFSLFLVAFMAMSLAAAPATQLKKLSDAPAQSANQQRALRQINQDVTKRANPAAVAEKSFSKRHALGMKKAIAEDILLNGEGFLVGPEYEAATGEWYIALEAQGYTFRLCWFGDEDNYCGTYNDRNQNFGHDTSLQIKIIRGMRLRKNSQNLNVHHPRLTYNDTTFIVCQLYYYEIFVFF